MIRSIRPGRKAYMVNYNDERSPFAHRPHVVEVAVLGLAHAMNDGRRPVLIGYPPVYDYQTGVTESLVDFLHATPEAAAGAFRRRWHYDCEPLPERAS